MANERDESPWASLNVPWVFLQGIVGGIAAGIVFALAQIFATVLQGQSPWVWIQMIAAIFLGNRALEGGEVAGSAVVVALGTHLALSAIYGIILSLLAAVGVAASPSPRALVLLGMLWGLLLWFVNYFVIAPFLFPWFGATDVAVQFILHVFFFGAPLGLFLAWRMAGVGTRPPSPSS